MVEVTQGVDGRWGALRTIEASKARQNFRQVVDDASRHGQRLLITRNGQPEAAIVSVRDLDFLSRRDALADKRSIVALTGRSPSTGAESRSLQEVMATRKGAQDTISPVVPDVELGAAEAESVEAVVAQVASVTVRNLVAATIARKASERMVDLINEWQGSNQRIGAVKVKKISAEMLETVQSTVVDLECDERFREQAQAHAHA